MLLATYLSVALSILPLFPHPNDKDGWGLRVCLDNAGPYFVGEWFSEFPFRMLLINYSKETRRYYPLTIAARIGDLKLNVSLNGEQLPTTDFHSIRRDSHEVFQLKPGHLTSEKYRISSFGYIGSRKPGTYRIDCTLKIGGKTITSPPVYYTLIEIPPEAVVRSIPVPVEGVASIRPLPDRVHPLLQQVKIGSRTLLIYRQYRGPESDNRLLQTNRICELPGKVTMKVEGAFGTYRPLTITYSNPSPSTHKTVLVVDSSDGRPWKKPKEKTSNEPIPPPRPVKP